MNIIVTAAELPEFTELCEQYGVTARACGHWPVYTAPGVHVQCHEFAVPDHTPVATWIAMGHPGWISDVWRATAQANTNPSLGGTQ